MHVIEFAKGHGTRNDFVIIPDPDNLLQLSQLQVAAICDRRGGIGADGLLRAVRADQVQGLSSSAPGTWFMDYCNADGSIGETCGNGLRVFLLYLVQEGLVDRPDALIITRAGPRRVRILPDGRIEASMGVVETGAPLSVRVGTVEFPAVAVGVGNPHAVVEVASAAELDALDLSVAPTWSPATAFPEGANVEFVHRIAPGSIRMRVYERGVGETESCGTGVVAAAAVLGGAPTCTVEVPGGRLMVDLTGPQALLIGPAVLVARGEFRLPD